MRRGASFHAAGRSLPGNSPQSAPTNPSALSRFSTPNLSRWPLHLLAPGQQPKISNRHLVRLEITTTSAESTSSLFLIDPNHADCSHQPLPTRIGGASVPPIASASRAASAAEAKFVHPISNRHLVQLEIITTRAESITSLFLIDPNQRHFARVDYSKPGPKSQRNFFEGGGLDGVGCYAQRRFRGRRALEAGSCKDETSARRPESNVVESGSRRDGGTPDPATAHLGIGILALSGRRYQT